VSRNGHGLVERLSVAIRSGRLSARQVTQATIDRIARHDGGLKAFVSIATESALLQADALDEVRPDLPLAGIPVAVKDIIDVAGVSTRAGSRAMEDAPPAQKDSEVVARLRAAGAIIIGKTKTTELATMDPTDTVNPYDPACTPGGSSSGSGAAVGAGLVPVALGTQTAGSLCRPAAYCGAAAFKPTHNRIPLTGITPLATSFDTVGPIARSQRDCAQVMSALGIQPIAMGLEGTRIAAPDAALWYPDADQSMLDYLDRVRRLLTGAGARVTTIPPLYDSPSVLADHRTVMAREAWKAHRELYRKSASLMGPNIAKLLAEGSEISDAAAAQARARLAAASGRVWSSLASFDACLLLPVPATAPRGHTTTGNASYLTPWSSFLGPLATLAGSIGPDGLPLAAMLASAPGTDERLLGLALAAEGFTDELPAAAPAFGMSAIEELLQ
jgi:Asp-tRNA(Asn)/Glu-tRNA(Gln) amidotransferase A subunit family amidase